MSDRNHELVTLPLAECVDEVTKGVGSEWKKYPLLGATRAGLAPAKEAIGKIPERYKPIEPGTVFYNPMRILLGSIAMVDDGEPTGITSPDYVVLRTRPGVLHHRFFYYWLRSQWGEALILNLARGAVRERILFRRLREGTITLPPWPVQQQIAEALCHVPRAREAAQARLAAAEALPAAYLREVFEGPEACEWEETTLGKVIDGIETGTSVMAESRPAAPEEWGVLKVSAVSWGRFKPEENKAVPRSYSPRESEKVKEGDLLISRCNTMELTGAVVLVRETPANLMLSDKTLRLVVKPTEFEPEFLELALRTRSAREFIEGRATGTSYSMRNISQDTIREVPVVKPSLTEQRVFLKRMKQWSPSTNSLIARCREELAAIEALPAALLRQAFGSTTA